MTSALPARARAAKLVDERSFPAHLRCSSCQNPLFNASQSPHGCRLCQTCVEKLPPQEKVPCPGTTEACRDKDEDTTVSQSLCFADTATRREIRKLMVFCPNKQEGCGAQLLWQDVESHLGSCDFEKVQCDMCGKEQVKKDLAAHRNNDCSQRRVQCKDCGVQVVALLMESEHKNLRSSSCCRHYKSSCPYCGQGDNRMSHTDFLSHLPMCPQQPTPCKFAHLGCPVVEAAAKLTAHYEEAAPEHLEMIDTRLRLTSQASSSAPAPAAASPPPSGTQREAAELQKKVLNIFQKFKDLQPNVATWAQTTLELEELMKAFGGPSGFKTLLKVMDEKLRQLEAAERAAGGGVSGAATSAASESERILDKMKTIEFSKRYEDRWKESNVLQQLLSFSPNLYYEYIVCTVRDGGATHTVFDHQQIPAPNQVTRSGVTSVSPEMMATLLRQRGSMLRSFLVWKISAVATRRLQSQVPRLFSKPFDCGAFKLRVFVYLNGWGLYSGSHLSLYLAMIGGPPSDSPLWPFKGKAKLTLIGPGENRQSAGLKINTWNRRTASPDDFSLHWGIATFLPINRLSRFVHPDGSVEMLLLMT